jgi:pimeloyl-ACP methyl ester carboxylesterase
MDVLIDAVDRHEPISMRAEIACTAGGLPIVEYLHASAVSWQLAPTVLGFSGGGMSGAMLALLAEHLAAHHIRLVAFDMPGHTPNGLLGANTPVRALISDATGAVRHAVGRTMILRWQSRSTSIQVLSHSAGIVDVARVMDEFGCGIDRFVITGSSIPGIAAMAHAVRASAAADALGEIRLSTLIRTRCLPAGTARLIYGPPANRVISDHTLARYECPEHVGVALSMLRATPVLRQNWRARRVLLIGSSGDAVVPADMIKRAHWRLRAQGAEVQSEILPIDLPHAFLSFQAGAAQVAELIAAGFTSTEH